MTLSMRQTRAGDRRRVTGSYIAPLLAALFLHALAPGGVTPIRAEETPEAPEAGRVRPGVSLDQFLDRGVGVGDSGREEGVVSPLGLLLRLSASVATILALGIAALFLYRRWLPRRAAAHRSGWLQVLGRTSLGPRHAVYLLRCGRRLVAVGVSGERMTPLVELDDEDAHAPTGRNDSLPKGFEVLADPREPELTVDRGGSLGQIDSADTPELKRLRGILRNWKEKPSAALQGGHGSSE